MQAARNILLTLAVLCIIFSCKKIENEQKEIKVGDTLVSSVSVDPEEAFLAGKASIDDASAEAYGSIAPNLSSSQNTLFQLGNSSFRDDWIIAPASTPGRDGLGPLLNAKSCGACHFKDGRGKPHDELMNPGIGLLLRLSVVGLNSKGESLPDPNYGGQFQPKSIPGITGEGSFRISYEEKQGKYFDETSYSLRKPQYSFDSLAYGPMNPHVLISPRVAQQMPGLGLLEAVSENTLLAMSDPFDRDGDGISGKINYVLHVESGTKKPGRFGWKANQPDLKQQVAAAFNNDIGVTNVLHDDEGLSEPQKELFKNLPNGGAPE